MSKLNKGRRRSWERQGGHEQGLVVSPNSGAGGLWPEVWDHNLEGYGACVAPILLSEPRHCFLINFSITSDGSLPVSVISACCCSLLSSIRHQSRSKWDGISSFFSEPHDITVFWAKLSASISLSWETTGTLAPKSNSYWVLLTQSAGPGWLIPFTEPS